MFPKLWHETLNLAPEIYFGLQEIPPYKKRERYHLDTAEDFVRLIREYCECDVACGFVGKEHICWHDVLEEELQLDLSAETVFIQRRLDPAGSKPSPWFVLRFLQEPVRTALLIGAYDAIMIEKTHETYQLCEALDEIWTRQGIDDLWSIMTDMNMRDIFLGGLMRWYEEENQGESSEMWNFWDTFSLHLIKERLFLRVVDIELNEPPF